MIFALSDDYTRHVVNMEPLLVEDEQKHAQMVKLKQRVHKLADLEV